MKRTWFTFLWLMLLVAVSCDGFGAGRAVAAGPAPETTDPHRDLDQILQQPPYQRWKLRQKGSLVGEEPAVVQGLGRWLRGVTQSVGEFFEWLFRRSRGRPAAPFRNGSTVLPSVLNTIAWTVAVVAVVILIGLIVNLLRQRRNPVGVARALSRAEIQNALQAGDALALDSCQWTAEAQRLAAEHDLRAVYRALYLALLAGLHKLGKIDFNRNRTNWTYVQRYRGPDQERVTFSELTGVFDHVWYGLANAEGRDLEHLQQRIAALTVAGEAS